MPTLTAPRPETGPPTSLREDGPDRHRPQLQRSVALVTGGGRGIGRMVAAALAGAGAAVGVLARSRSELDGTVELIRGSGGRAQAETADVADEAALAAAVAELQARLGPVDLLVNNAGILGPIGPLWELDTEDWWRTIEVNLRGVLIASRLVLPTMVERGGGRIINITSQAGAYRWPLVSAYSVSKAAVTKLSENLAHETRRYGISVFSVHPGLLPIGISETVAGREPASVHEEQIQQWAENEFRHGRGADPDSAIELILRLAAGDGDGLSGRHLSVHDELDTILTRLAEVQEHDLYVTRPGSLGTDSFHHIQNPVLLDPRHRRMT